MSEISAKIRDRIEAQGFLSLDDRTLKQINYWLRFSPAICMSWTAVGTALASPGVLLALAPFALLGGLLTGHPFDAFYNHGIRHLLRTPHLPRYGRPRRFACLLASTIILAAAAGFYFGYPLIGYGFGIFLVGAAFVNVSTGFCIPSFIYGLLFGKPECELDTLNAMSGEQ